MEKQALLAGGCFWGMEAKFQKLAGVLDTQVGYSGGVVENPTYKEVCCDETGHVETVLINYDPDQISYQQLLEAFFSYHDPTVSSASCENFGSQYRSVIFYRDEQDRDTAEQVMAFLDVSGRYERPIITQLLPASPFYPAEEYHQHYYRKHGLTASDECEC